MVPGNGAVRNYIQSLPAYAALDEYIRWDISTDNGGGRHRKHANLLDHLSHVYTNEGTGPSLLEYILEMLKVEYDDKNAANWEENFESLIPWRCRLISKSIGSAFTKVFCFSKLSVRVDGYYIERLFSRRRTHTLNRFLDGFLGIVNRTSDIPCWRANPNYIKELEFTQDPEVMIRKQDIYEGLEEPYHEGHISEELEVFLKDQTQKTLDHEFENNDIRIRDYWWRIGQMVQSCKNLEGFKWSSSMPVHRLVFQVLAFSCPRLTHLDLSSHDHFMLNLGKHDKTLINALAITAEERAKLTLSKNCQVKITLNYTQDSKVWPAFRLLGRWCPEMDSLLINRNTSTTASEDDLQRQGPDPIVLFDKEKVEILPQETPSLRVRHLSVHTIGSLLRYIMAAIDPGELRSLSIMHCEHLHYIFVPLVRNSPQLKRFKIQFISNEDAINRPSAYWQAHVQNQRFVFDFLRAGVFQLEALDIVGDFADEMRQPVNLSLLSTDLFMAIQAHFKSLLRLHVLNTGVDFRYEEIVEIGRNTPNLVDFGISVRTGANTEDDEMNNEGLGWTLERALLSFRAHKPFALTIIRTGTGQFGGSMPIGNTTWGIPTTHSEAYNQVLMSCQRAVLSGVKLVQMAYFQESLSTDYDAYRIWTVPDDGTREHSIESGVATMTATVVADANAYANPDQFHEEFMDAQKKSFATSGIPPMPSIDRQIDKIPKLLQRHIEKQAYDGTRSGATLGHPNGEGPSDDRYRLPQPEDIPAHVMPLELPSGRRLNPVVIDLDVRSLSGVSRIVRQPAAQHNWQFAEGPIIRVAGKNFMQGFDGRILIKRFKRFVKNWIQEDVEWIPLFAGDPRGLLTESRFRTEADYEKAE